MTTVSSHYPLQSDGAMNSDQNQPNSPENTNNSPAMPGSEKKGEGAAQLKKLQRLVRHKSMSPFAHIRHSKKRAFATALAITGMKGRAAELAGVHKSTPNTKHWREDRELQEALRKAEQMVGDLIEDELYRRGVEGVTEPTGFYKGEAGAYVQRYDTTAAIFLLKGLRPEKYAERSEVRSISANINLNLLPNEVIDRLSKGEDYQAVMAAYLSDLQAKGESPPAGLLPSPGG